MTDEGKSMRKEYFVEVYANGQFSHQIDEAATYDDAVALAESMKATLEKGEHFHITTVTYDEDGEEVEMWTEAIAA